jgi:hypothetical protein
LTPCPDGPLTAGPGDSPLLSILMLTPDITADLDDEDDTGYVWTFLDEARDPAVVVPGAIVVASTPGAPTEVVDLVTKPAGTVVHLRVLPGSVRDYATAVSRATTPA